eukprot:6874094-Prymnesium_polylepis.1
MQHARTSRSKPRARVVFDRSFPRLDAHGAVALGRGATALGRRSVIDKMSCAGTAALGAASLGAASLGAARAASPGAFAAQSAEHRA